MKFGPVPLGQAMGAILAHSVALDKGRLRKGVTLDEGHIAALEAAGLREVIAARLEPGDVDENSAATALAAALVPDPEAAGLVVETAFTGRVNILAKSPGVVELDDEALTALNAIDPMITLATVPPYQQMDAGGMVGTVKIISYAVAGDALKAACEAVSGAGAGALRLRRPVYQSAGLIVTEIAGGAGEKGVAAIEARLDRLGLSLNEVSVTPHETEAVARALSSLKSDIGLILTGSATSDLYDVAPDALRRAGGVVTRFGMPVDPGNLLFLGVLRDRPVIGLPGCARSPALNGADWVLSRVACGCEVTGQDIAAMGVGGLLKEIPTRPHPRRRKG